MRTLDKAIARRAIAAMKEVVDDIVCHERRRDAYPPSDEQELANDVYLCTKTKQQIKATIQWIELTF
jgi:hypothetical protein